MCVSLPDCNLFPPLPLPERTHTRACHARICAHTGTHARIHTHTHKRARTYTRTQQQQQKGKLATQCSVHDGRNFLSHASVPCPEAILVPMIGLAYWWLGWETIGPRGTTQLPSFISNELSMLPTLQTLRAHMWTRQLTSCDPIDQCVRKSSAALGNLRKAKKGLESDECSLADGLAKWEERGSDADLAW